MKRSRPRLKKASSLLVLALLVLYGSSRGFCQTSPRYVSAADITVQVGGETVVLKKGQPIEIIQLAGGKAIISVKLSDGSSGVTQIDASALKPASANPTPALPAATPAPTTVPQTRPTATPPPQTSPESEAKPLTFDCNIPVLSGANYSKAQFRLWSPAYAKPIQGIIVLSPGTDADARSWVNEKGWQTFAIKYRMALIGTSFKSQPNSDYTDAPGGSGKALLAAITEFTADLKNHPELDQAPLLLYGISAGGEFNYNFAMWQPTRTISFVVNKGAYYNQRMPSADFMAVPGLFFLGLKDEQYRIDGITKIWTQGRKAGALWALAKQPNSGHEFSKTAPVAQVFFDAVLKARLPDGALSFGDASTLRPMAENRGWLGDLATFAISDASMENTLDGGSNDLAAWFPDQASAAAWKSFVSVPTKK